MFHERVSRAGGVLALLAVTACRSNETSSAVSVASASATASGVPTPAPVSPPRENPADRLPKADLTFHRVAQGSSRFALAQLENGALLYPSVDRPLDAIKIQKGRADLVPGLFEGVTVPDKWSFGPVEGRWPDFLVLTLAHRRYRGHASDATILRRTGARWTAQPGDLADYSRFVILRPVHGQRWLFVQTKQGWEFRDPQGRPAPPKLEATVDKARFTVTSASVDAKGQIFVSGFIPEPPPPGASALDLAAGSGGGIDGGIAVVQRFPPGATKPIVERMPGPKPALVDELSGAGVFSHGATTFFVLGRSRAMARFADGRWTVEDFPIDPDCSGIRNFTVAADGSIWFGTRGDPARADVFLRRAPDGSYARLPLPPDTRMWGLHAESATDVWLVASREKAGLPQGMLFHTAPPKSVITLDPPEG